MPERRRETLALAFQELITVGERLRSHRQSVNDAQAFRKQIWQGVERAQADALKLGYNGDDIEKATFAVVAYIDESVLNAHDPVFSEWPRLPLQEERYGHHIAGEIFFQNLQNLMGRAETYELADLLEVYYLCMLLGYAGRYAIGARGELAAIIQRTGEKIRRIRRSSAEISPYWMLPRDNVQIKSGDPLVKGLLFSTIGLLLLTIVLFVVFHMNLSSGISTMRSLASQTL